MRIEAHERTKFLNSVITLLAYVDDVVLMEESQDSVKQFFEKLNDATQIVELHINEQNPGCIIVGRRN